MLRGRSLGSAFLKKRGAEGTAYGYIIYSIDKDTISKQDGRERT